MAILWNKILNRFNATSACLQSIQIYMITADNMLKSIITFVNKLKNDLMKF